MLGVSGLPGLYGFGTYGVIGASSGGGGLAGYFAGKVTYANAHRIPVELAKPAKEQGKYLHPELYGKPSSLSVVPKVAAKALTQARR